LYNFKKIQVHSAGHRDPDSEGTSGMSGTKMREHAKNKDIGKFKQGVPSHVPEHHAKELMKDVRKGMGIHENVDRGLFKAIFITGGPGSGKDIVIREAIAENKAVEINSVQAFDYLMDKQKLSEKTNDVRRESIRNRGPLIINGPADDHTRIITIKEELEELGYETIMVFVETTNETSKERNEKLTKMVSESVRQEKWKLSQTNKEAYVQNFDKFVQFDNSVTLDSIEEKVTDTYKVLNKFIDNKNLNEVSHAWLQNHGKLNINDSVKFLFKENDNVKKTIGFVSKTSIGRDYTRFFKKPGFAKSGNNLPKSTPDNRASDPNGDNIKWNANNRRGSFTPGQGGTYTEATTTNKTAYKEENQISKRESDFALEIKMTEMVGGLSNALKLQNEFINKRLEIVDNTLSEKTNAMQDNLKSVLQETSDRLDKLYLRDINIPAPIINVPAPVVNVSLSEQKKVIKTVDRNSEGFITKITEETDDTLTNKDS
jgi:predicted kinase